MDIISYERVIQQLSFSEAIQVMKRCFAELQKGKISQSERHVEVLPDGENQNLFALYYNNLKKMSLLRVYKKQGRDISQFYDEVIDNIKKTPTPPINKTFTIVDIFNSPFL